ncbi:UDP-N-acetylmuramoyl-L-alanyl-D-glutamate--2,6-diaminopimelate ligase [Gemmatimonadetes bacterium T265]|nr:UDP-N-acetylmuramoyl-L-alanyl-D-glutamate--2,6-diaminopimelate ligase [Gemmatimonadetes bacterium T265]
MTDPARAGAPVRTGRIADALERAGLLVGARGAVPEAVTGLTDDSRRVTPGGLFVAVRGARDDGHQYLDAAAGAGAVVALVERPDATALPSLVVRDGRRAAALAAAAFYGEPASALTLVGVTGTNGKTTTAAMLRHLLDAPGASAASIGTLGVLVGSTGEPFGGGGGLTTPGPVELQRVLRALVDAGVRTVAMEVSSHALEQRRVEGVRFAAAVFTNFTRDHLDYHETMEAYFAAKARLVDALAPGGALVVNADDRAWDALPAAPRVVRWGMAGDAAGAAARGLDVAAVGATAGATGTRFALRVAGADYPAHVPLLGDYNVANALGAASAAWVLGTAPPECAARLATLPQVPGRLELLRTRPAVLRDYAHTPNSLERALAAVRPFARGRVVVVFGAGGDRDRGKRPAMARAAEAGADVVVITSDNPRTEDPEHILDDVEAGLTRAHERIEDRRAAIARALEIAGPDDVVLLAGKGHETYQIRGATTLPFDEAAIVRELAARGGRAGHAA